MAFYNDKLKTLIVDPVYSDNKRTELRLEDNVFLSNMRLTNVGCTLTGATDLSHSANAGAWCMIDAIHLYSGSQVLQSVRNVGQLASFRNLLHPNGANGSLHKVTIKSSLGFEVNDNDGLIHATGDPNNVNKLERADVFNAERLQVIMNNANVFDYNGVDSPMRKLTMLTDAWGPLNIPLGSNLDAVTKSANLYPATSIPLYEIATAGYYGFRVDARVSNLQLKYQRTGTANHPSMTMHLFGEVVQQIQYTQTGFYIAYV